MRPLSLGKLAFKYFYKPTSPFRYKFYNFGFKGWLDYSLGEYQMQKNALSLPSIMLNSSKKNVFEINFLTGEKYWHQTLFCIQSLTNQCGNDLAIKIYSDGTINKRIINLFKGYCPQIIMVSDEEILDSLNTIIPAEKFPTLHYLRRWHPYFRRIIDIHCCKKWKLHLDSDMLFYKFPIDLVEFARTETAVFLEEQMGSSYFVDNQNFLMSKYGIPTLENVNGGVIGYDGNLVDYDELECKAKILIDNYFLQGPAKIEQTLMSYILYKQSGVALDKHEYKIHYSSTIAKESNTLRHYIYKAKQPYFSEEWKRIT